MHHYIHTSAKSLEFRQSASKFRIHNRKFTMSKIAAVSALQHSIVICNNRRFASLASSGGDCQNRADWRSPARLVKRRLHGLVTPGELANGKIVGLLVG